MDTLKASTKNLEYHEVNSNSVQCIKSSYDEVPYAAISMVIHRKISVSHARRIRVRLADSSRIAEINRYKTGASPTVFKR